MSVALLSQVFDETRRLAIAGSMVAPGDFRLKKLAPPLQQAGAKSPVFARIGEAVNAVVDSNEQSAAPALLTLSTLINAVLYTQGETGNAGKLSPLQRIDFGIAETQASARVLKPLLEALTSTGSGRLELIRDGFERGEFRDLRLIQPAVAGLDDGYGEIADYIGDNVLPAYGKAILPALLSQFDPKGKTGDARRLKLIAKLDPAAGRELLLKSLSEGSRETKLVAISLLGDHPEDVPLLLEQLKQKSSAVRGAAIQGLARSSEPEAVAALCELIEKGKDTGELTAAIRETRNPALVAKVIEQVPTLLESLKTAKFKTNKEADPPSRRVYDLLESLRGNADPQVGAFLLALWEDREQIAKTKGNFGGDSLVNQLADLMSVSSDQAKQRLIAEHTELPASQLGFAFEAACSLLSSAELFDQFSHYLTAPEAAKGKKAKDARQAAEKREQVFQGLVSSQYQNRYAWLIQEQLHPQEEVAPLDPRWLDSAVALEEMELIQAVARPNHAALNAYLTKVLQKEMGRSAYSPFDSAEVLHTMVKVNHPEAVDSVIAAIQNTAKNTRINYSVHWFGRLIESLPPETAPRFEEMLAALPEKYADQLVGAVATLKLRAAQTAQNETAQHETAQKT